MIYIVIPVHNRKELTRNCLASLRQQEGVEFSLIVVDDGSTDGTSEMLQTEFPEVKVIRGDGNWWWAGSINQGIRFALERCQANDYILTLNDDLIVKPNYLASLLAQAQKSPRAIIGSLETTSLQPDIIKSGGIVINWKTAKEKTLNKGKNLNSFPDGFCLEVSSLTGRGTLFPSQVFREIGLFDEQQIKQCADTELPIRAKLRFGYQLLVSYRAVVITHIATHESINDKNYYKISDMREYFFNIKSHYNLLNRYWIAKRIAPNKLWFFRYLTLNIIRTIGHYVLRLRIR